LSHSSAGKTASANPTSANTPYTNIGDQRQATLKKRLFHLAKIVVPLAILAWLVAGLLLEKPDSPGDPTTLDILRSRPVRWEWLLAGFVCVSTAICITFVRWWLLVRTLGISLSLAEAFRLGFLGFAMNFVSAGTVGGDLFKAIFLAHDRKGKRPEAVATVIVDRMIGLYALLVVTAGATFFIAGRTTGPLVTISRAAVIGSLIGGIAIMLLLVPGFSNGRITAGLTRLPKIGTTIERLLSGIRMYRNRPGVLTLIALTSLGVHALFSLGLYFTSVSLFEITPTFYEHLVIVPVSMLAGALPISPNGLGTFELAMKYLYTNIAVEKMPDDQGTVIALLYRLFTIVLSAIGLVYYLASRREVAEVIHEAEEYEEMEGHGLQPTTGKTRPLNDRTSGEHENDPGNDPHEDDE